MGLDHELRSMGKSPHHSELEAQTKDERDAQVLARLGKKSVLEVRTHTMMDSNKSCVLTCISVDLALFQFADSRVQYLSHGKVA